MTLGGAAQVAAAHCPNERAPQSAAITDPPMPQPAALWPSPRNVLRQRLTNRWNNWVRSYYKATTGSTPLLLTLTSETMVE